MRPLEVLLVEDNPGDARLLREMVREPRHQPVTLEVVTRLEQARQRLAERDFDLVLLDLTLPDAQQLTGFHRLRAEHPELPVIMVTGLEDEQLARTAAVQGAQDYLVKGTFGSEALMRSMHYALERQRMVGDLRRAMERVAGSEERLRGIVTSNPDPVLVVDGEGVIRFANLAAVVLFGAGETDLTGKPFGLTCQTGVRTEVELPGPGGAPISLELWAVETEWDGRPAQLVAARDVSERRHAQHRLWLAHLDTIQRLILASELKDRDTAAHVQRIGETCAILGRALGLPGPQAELLRQASQMHDVGKIGVPDSILLKPGPLTPGERQVMEEHTFIGARLLHGSPSHLLHTGEVIALSHHERWDGRGYPLGLAGDDIPLFGRICAVADFFDALTSDRPYRGARPVEETLALMEEERGGHFDPGLLDLFRLHLDAVLEVRRGFDTAPPHGTLSDLFDTAPIVGLEAAGCPCADGTPFGLDAVPPGTLPSR